jgi:hypothetical protein
MPDSRSFAIAGRPRNAAVIARTKLNMNAAGSGSARPRCGSRARSRPFAGEPGEGAGPQLGQRDADDGEREQTHRIRRRAASRIVSRRDRDHGVRSVRRALASSARKRSSSERRPASTSWTRPPAATIAATRSGTRLGSNGSDRQPVAVRGAVRTRSSAASAAVVEAGGLHADARDPRGPRRAGPPRRLARGRRSPPGRTRARPRSAGAS